MNHFYRLNQCYIIAEIGVNHNGDLKLAIKMIDEAKKAGANAVKFQTFTAESLVSRGTPKVRYQKSTTSPDESHFEMIKKLELRPDDHYKLMDYCEKIEIDFLSTPYDIESAKLLDKLGVWCFKTASADIVDLPLQKWIAKTGKPAIISVGMASLGEIEKVVNIYRECNNKDIILLHCVSNYPCADESINLKVMQTLHQAFDLPVGYSDHSIGSVAAIASIVFGAKVIEKHFTLDKNFQGPDHLASSTPDEFNDLVVAVRRTENILGSSYKSMQNEEEAMARVSRKSIVLAKDINHNEKLTMAHLTLKRPGSGLSAIFIDMLIGKKVNKTLKRDTMISWNDLN